MYVMACLLNKCLFCDFKKPVQICTVSKLCLCIPWVYVGMCAVMYIVLFFKFSVGLQRNGCMVYTISAETEKLFLIIVQFNVCVCDRKRQTNKQTNKQTNQPNIGLHTVL